MTTHTKINASIDGGTASFDKNVVSHPFNVEPELANVRRVRVTFTKAVDRQAKGVSPPLTSSGWDYGQSLLRDDVDYEVRIDERRWVAQRFSFTSSAGGLIARFRVRRPVATSVSSGELWAAITSEQPGKITQKVTDFDAQIPDFVRLGVLLPEQRPETVKLVSNDWFRIPYAEIGQAGTDIGSDGPDPPSTGSTSSRPVPGPDCWMEFRFPEPLKPNTPYWMVLRAVSSGTAIPAGNLYVKAYLPATVDLSNYGVIREPSNAGGGDRMLSLQEAVSVPVAGPKSKQLSFYLAPTQALSSSGRSGEGNGNGGYVVEPVTGEHFPLLSLPGQHQQFGFVEFPTSTVVRKNAHGDTETAFTVSFGKVPSTGAALNVLGGSNQDIRRADYTLSVDYVT